MNVIGRQREKDIFEQTKYDYDDKNQMMMMMIIRTQKKDK